jgi:hypothetical protein
VARLEKAETMPLSRTDEPVAVAVVRKTRSLPARLRLRRGDTGDAGSTDTDTGAGSAWGALLGRHVPHANVCRTGPGVCVPRCGGDMTA